MFSSYYKKAFTLIELLAVIVILAVISLIATPIILGIIEDSKRESFKASAYGMIDAARQGFTLSVINSSAVNTVYTYEDGVETRQSGNIEINYNGSKPQSGSIQITIDGDVAVALYDGKYCALKGYNDTVVTVSEVTSEECTLVTISYAGWSETKTVNAPELTTGLTPIVWNGSAWVTTTADDTNWYDYTTNNKWANAMSADGSLWVWIPRFAYQVNTNYHTSSGTGGVVNIKFLKGNSDDSSDTTDIGLTPTYSGSAQTNYIVHPGFTFGTKQLTGLWVAKFEATAAEDVSNITSCGNQLDNVSTKTVKIVPNATAWRCISISNAFTSIRNMETNGAYGWNSINVDTHLIKNSEWGAVSYLSQSSYGKGTSNIYMNPNSNYVTGCAGTSAGQSQTTSCNAYTTSYGLNTSTTLNIYGVYDMSGGSAEFTAAHVNNFIVGDAAYITALALMEADSKYRDTYPLGTTDTGDNNYLKTQDIYGDGIWEMSIPSGANNAWYLDGTVMPSTIAPWFVRGGHNRSFNGAGLYAFATSGGGTSADFGFRPVLLVGTNI